MKCTSNLWNSLLQDVLVDFLKKEMKKKTHNDQIDSWRIETGASQDEPKWNFHDLGRPRGQRTGNIFPSNCRKGGRGRDPEIQAILLRGRETSAAITTSLSLLQWKKICHPRVGGKPAKRTVEENTIQMKRMEEKHRHLTWQKLSRGMRRSLSKPCLPGE